jgi:hypothetical protein
MIVAATGGIGRPAVEFVRQSGWLDSVPALSLECRAFKWIRPSCFGDGLSIAEVRNLPSSTSRPML